MLRGLYQPGVLDGFFSHGMKGRIGHRLGLGSFAKRGAITEMVNHRNPSRREIQFVTPDHFFNQDINLVTKWIEKSSYPRY